MRRFTLFLSFALFLLFTLSASGQQVVLHVPGDYTTIQEAIDAAGFVIAGPSPADVLIEVSPGTYPESIGLDPINSPTHTVTLRAVAGPMVTIIDPPKDGNHALRGQFVQNFILDGFTVRNRYDPLQVCCGRGMRLIDSNHITVQNCHFDTTFTAMSFNMRDPNVISEVVVAHNTVFSGQGSAPGAPDFMTGQAVDFSTMFSPNTWEQGPAAYARLVVADNVFRSVGGSCVRFVLPYWSPDGSLVLGGFPKASLTMTGNDVACQFAAGVNLTGGHGNLIAGNRMHDSAEGAQVNQMYGARFENNLILRNDNGLVFFDTEFPAGPMLAQPVLVDHNTIVNNIAAGIVYNTNGPGRANIPVVTNNIVAFNDGGGLVAVQGDPVDPLMSYISVDFHAAGNDVYGNTVRGLYTPSAFFNFAPITNPQLSDGNYSGVINGGLDLSVVPDFVNPQAGDFSLKPNSRLVNASVGYGPHRDLAGTMRDAAPDIGALEAAEKLNVNVRAHPLAGGNKTKPE